MRSFESIKIIVKRKKEKKRNISHVFIDKRLFQRVGLLAANKTSYANLC